MFCLCAILCLSAILRLCPSAILAIYSKHLRSASTSFSMASGSHVWVPLHLLLQILLLGLEGQVEQLFLLHPESVWP